jgi:alpha-glucosidase
MIHNVYGQDMARATREGLQQLRPGQRQFVLSRAGYAGAQRYAAFWTGDNSATWDHLRLNLTMVMNLGLSGFPFVGADVGGYKGNPSPELMARWMELGSLMPFYRNHTEKGDVPHEPWAFGDAVETASRLAIERRYRLMPYLYDLAHQASLTGAPLVRPLFWAFPAESANYTTEDQFMLGDALMAAPVLVQGQTARAVRFPAGTTWYDWDSGAAHPGGSSFNQAAPLESLPLFARAGAIVATHETEQWVGEKPANPLTIRIWPPLAGAVSETTIYRDNGRDLAWQDGDYLQTTVRVDATGPGLSVTVRPNHPAVHYREAAGNAWLSLRLEGPPRQLRLDGRPIELGRLAAAAEDSSVWDTPSGSQSAFWDAGHSCLSLRIPPINSASTLEIVP